MIFLFFKSSPLGLFHSINAKVGVNLLCCEGLKNNENPTYKLLRVDNKKIITMVAAIQTWDLCTMYAKSDMCVIQLIAFAHSLLLSKDPIDHFVSRLVTSDEFLKCSNNHLDIVLA